MDTRARLKIWISSEVPRTTHPFFVLLLLVQCLSLSPTVAQTNTAAMPLCDILQSPDRFDKQTIQLRGNVHLSFEVFSLTSEECPRKWPGIWLAFGGDAATPTMSTVNDTVRPPGVTRTFGGIAVQLVKDDNFERFFALISARRGRDPLYDVTATLTGTFLAGNRKLHSDGKLALPGYGHLGCCFLFVISRVDAADAVPSPQLSVSGTLKDAAGAPVSGVDVYSQTVNCCQPQLVRTRSDDAGYFSIKNAGQVLTFLKTGYRPQSLVLQTGRQDLQLTMESTSAYDWQVPVCKGVLAERQFRGLPLRVVIPEGLHSEQALKTPDSPFIIHRRVSDPFIGFPEAIRTLLLATQPNGYSAQRNSRNATYWIRTESTLGRTPKAYRRTRCSGEFSPCPDKKMWSITPTHVRALTYSTASLTLHVLDLNE